MMHPRILQVLNVMNERRQTLSSEYLAKRLSVSTRTIRTDIRELNEHLTGNGAKVDALRGSGYQLEVEDEILFNRFLEGHLPSEGTSNFNSPLERIRYIIRRLLFADEHVRLEDLADELYISKSTVQADLKEVKQILERYALWIEIKPKYGMKLQGDEIKRRFCLSEYGVDRAKDLPLIDDSLHLLDTAEFSAIRESVLDKIREYAIVLSDVGLHNLIIHLAIACRRIREGNSIDWPLHEEELLRQHAEYQVAIELVALLEERLSLTFPSAEISYVTIHLLGTKLGAETARVEAKLNDGEVTRVTDLLICRIEQELRLPLSHDSEFRQALLLHLRPALNRYRYGMNLRNPLLSGIKTHYPVAFEAAVLASRVLSEELEMRVTEDEIGYIAIHIGAALERQRLETRQKRVLIVCASGIGSAKLLLYKLQAEFAKELDVVGTTEYYQLQHTSLEGIDFLISTIPVPDPLPVPVIVVDTFLGQNGLQQVRRMLKPEVAVAPSYLRKETVFLRQDFEQPEQVVRFLGAELEQLELVPSGFAELVLEREACAPTSFGNLVAIPHPMRPVSDETFWSICTLQKPIRWGSELVQFVLLLSVERESEADMQDMYALLHRLIDDPKAVNDLIKAKEFDALEQLLLALRKG